MRGGDGVVKAEERSQKEMLCERLKDRRSHGIQWLSLGDQTPVNFRRDPDNSPLPYLFSFYSVAVTKHPSKQNVIWE